MLDIYVINLLERSDRYDNIKNIFKNFNIIRVDAVKRKYGAVGCFESHVKCIKIAKEKKLKNILVIEDDCIPYHDEKNFCERLVKIKNILDNNDDWDIYVGQSSKIEECDIKEYLNIDNEKFVKVTKSYGFIMVCYNEKVYDFFINSDPRICPIDKIWSDKLTALLSVPFIVEQIDGYSNISNRPISVKGRIKLYNNLILDHITKYES